MPGLTKEEMKRRTDEAVEEATAQLQQRIAELEAQLAQQGQSKPVPTFIAVGTYLTFFNDDDTINFEKLAAVMDAVKELAGVYEDVREQNIELKAQHEADEAKIAELEAQLAAQPTSQVDLEQMTNDEFEALRDAIMVERNRRQDEFTEQMRAENAALEAQMAELEAQIAQQQVEVELDPAAPHGGSGDIEDEEPAGLDPEGYNLSPEMRDLVDKGTVKIVPAESSQEGKEHVPEHLSTHYKSIMYPENWTGH